MNQSKITYYPVDNGDQSLISVFENNYTTNIIVDCKIRESSKGDDDTAKFDVKAHLLKELKKRTVNSVENVPYADIFVLTHGDDDHLHGFENNFYQGNPKNYGDKNRNAGEILIDVLWFSPMVMGPSTNDDEDCFNAEAKRRIKLHRDNSLDKDLAGNRIVIIGYDENEDLSGLNLVRKVPGDIVTRFNDRDLKTFSIFIHAPYKKQLTSADSDKNHTSVVFQARFKESALSYGFCTLAMFGGDADHYAWNIVLEKTKKYKKDVSERALDWDLFLAPHHCSWSYFNDTPQKDFPTPVDSSLEILDYARKGAKVIASCKVIKNNDDNPPHYKAKKEYVGKLEKEDNFLNTAIHPDEKAPEPIVFIVTANGPTKQPNVKIGGAINAAGGLGAASTIVKQG
jgi:hypothetical protein